jgi:hypothetical protein
MMATNKNVYFRPVDPNRKSCPGCHEKLEEGESVWAMGEYGNARWYNVIPRFCKKCVRIDPSVGGTIHTKRDVDSNLWRVLQSYVRQSNRMVVFNGYHCDLPEWLKKIEVELGNLWGEQ